MIAANRGEWSELYVLFKLLADGKIYSANENLEKNIDSYLEIIKILREEVVGVVKEYHTGASVEIIVEGQKVAEIPASDFLVYSDILLHRINTAEGRAFSVPEEVEEFLARANITTVKAKSVSSYGDFGGKNDIVMQVKDPSTAIISTLGFSIKAKGKSASTLFNTAKASAFVYKLNNITDEQMNLINSLRTSKGGKDKAARINYILANDIEMQFVGNKILEGRDYSVFENNLDLVRGDMQEILNEMMLIHYTCEGSHSRIKDICDVLVERNPLGKREPQIFYKKAIKDFLYATFTGMTASLPWDGREVVSGGYIVAKDNGEVLAFHTRDGESFKTFLFNTTRFDRPDASERKGYPYADVYKIGDEYYFDLNFQVRFCD